MAAPKLVKLQHVKTGVVVQTTEENAGRLAPRAYEPAKASSAASKTAAPSKKS